MAEEVTDLTRGVYRRLYAGFIKGQRINKISLQAEAWFWRIFAVADDFGNYDADPELLRDATKGRRKVSVKQVERWLNEMADVGLVSFYQNKSERYLHILRFEDTQPAGKNGKRLKRFPLPGESGCIQVNPELSSASDSEDDNDPENDNEGEARAAKLHSPAKPKQCDEDFLAELQADEAYQKLNVKQVYAKMVRWCSERGKVATRRRLINWLNREDVPLNGANNGTNTQNNELRRPTAAERNNEQLRRNLAVVEKLRRESGGDPGEVAGGNLSTVIRR